MIYILIPLLFIILLSEVVLTTGVNEGDDGIGFIGAVILLIAIGTCVGIIVNLTN